MYTYIHDYKQRSYHQEIETWLCLHENRNFGGKLGHVVVAISKVHNEA